MQELKSDGFDVATAYSDDGTEYDRLGSWETVQNYANQGFRCIVHTGDAWFSRDELQRMASDELAAADDCFGASIRLPINLA